MALLGPLDPRPQQDRQQAAITAQSQHWEDELTKMLREHGQTQQQPFTSPWQVAGQMAQALSGRMHANQNAQNYATLNANLAPGEGQGEQPTPAAPQATPTPQNAPAASPAAPQASAAPAAQPQGQQTAAADMMPTHYPAGTHKYKEFSPEVKQAIQEGAQQAGVDPQMIAEFAHFESDGDPNAHRHGSRYKGLTQLSEEEMARVSGGQGNVWNPRDAARAAGMIAKENAAAFEKFTGRPATNFDQYMMHQQGRAGYFQHLGDPNNLAWKNMAAAGEHHAQDAITVNGGKLTDTSAQFLQRWHNKYAQVQRGDFAPAGQQTAQVGPGGAPGAPGAPGAAAAAPGQPPGIIERGRFFGPEGYSSPQSTYTPQQLDTLARSGRLSVDEIRQLKQEQTATQQLRTREVPGMGTFSFDPRSGHETYMPTVQTKPVKGPGGIEIQQQFYVNSRGQRVPIGEAGGSSAAPGAPGAPGAAAPAGGTGGNLGAAMESGDIKKILPAASAYETEQAGKKKGAETLAEGQGKEYQSIHAGITGAGLNYAAQAPNIKTLLKLAPNASTGTGSETMLALNRLGDKIGLSKRAAAPQELFRQLATKILADQFSSIRNTSMEEGSPAARVFKSMLDVEEKANITDQDSLEGIVSKLKRMQKVAGYGMKWANMADDEVKENKQLGPEFMKKIRKEISEADYDEEAEGQPAPAAGKPGGTPIERAKDAIKRGAPREQVIKRLRENGIEPGDL